VVQGRINLERKLELPQRENSLAASHLPFWMLILTQTGASFFSPRSEPPLIMDFGSCWCQGRVYLLLLAGCNG
jgi:hypothetical protein